MALKVAFHNLGCKVNSYETQAMAGLFKKRGYEIVEWNMPFDICIINTCTVTNTADRKSRQMLHKAKKQNPDAFIVAAGCYVQADPEKAAEDECVDLVIGNIGKINIVDTVEEAMKYKRTESIGNINDINDIKYENISITSPVGYTRADIKIQDGCNQFCTYCLIPYVRGRIRSRSMEDILIEAQRIAEAGYQELVLTGIHISSYGRDLDENIGLTDVLKSINDIEKIKRIRLGSLEPGIINDKFILETANIPKLCPHFHLSLQSGCNTVLKRMNRHYTAEEYYEKVCMLREAYSHPAVTTDIITGFPGESNQEFSETLEFVKKVRFYETHIFPFSRRKGTVADRMEGQLPKKLKDERAGILIHLNESNSYNFRKEKIGSVDEVLFEEEYQFENRNLITGYTSDYVRVAMDAGDAYNNRIKKIKLSGMLTNDIMYGFCEESR